MHHNGIHQLGAFVLVLSAMFASAVPFFPNVTTSTFPSLSAASPSVTSDLAAATLPCFNDLGFVCDRPGQPVFDYDATNYLNPFYGVATDGSSGSECASLFDSSLSAWLMTAPIGGNESSYTSIGGGTSYSVELVGISTTTYAITTTEVEDVTIGGVVTTVTGLSVDTNGVQVPWTQTRTVVLITTTWTETSDDISSSTVLTTTAPQWTSVVTVSEHPSYLEEFSFTPITPCCMDCTLFAGDVEVYYWPTSTQSPPVSRLINSANFTFTSPSVYVAFHSLYATNYCSTIGGLVVNATTLAFPDNELSTALGYYWNTEEYLKTRPFLPPVYTAATFGDQKVCTNVTESFYQFWGANTGLTWIEYYSTETYSDFQSSWGSLPGQTFYHYTVTYNPCLPSISVPTELFTILPAWSTCSQGIPGLYDPPYALSSGHGLVAFTTAPDHISTAVATITSETAAAGPTIAPVTPTATVPAELPTSPNNGKPTGSVVGDPAVQASGSDSPAKPSAADPNQTPNDDPPADASTQAANDPSSPSQNNDPPAQSPTTTSLTPAPAIITIGGSAITADPSSAFVIGSQTLTAGGQITYSGTVVSLDPSGTAIVIGDTTQTLSPSTQAAAYTIGTQILSAGDAVTVSGTTYSLQSDGSSLFVNGHAQPLTVTSEYIIASQTLIAGGPMITVSGTEISLQMGGSSVVVDGQTEALSVLGASTTGLGGVIVNIGGFENPTTRTPTSSVLASGGAGYNGTMFVGVASRIRRKVSVYAMGVMVGLGIVLVGYL